MVGKAKGCLTFLLFALFVSQVLMGCAAKGNPRVWSIQPQAELVWPQPPVPARIRYLLSYSDPEQFYKDEGQVKNLFRKVTGYEEERFPLVAPFGVTADGSGRIWVADTGGAMVHAIDIQRAQVEYLRFAGKESLISPVGVALDKEKGYLYVSDSVLRRVYVFDLSGNLQGERTLPGGFERPTALAIGPSGKLFVTDSLSGKIQVFSRAGDHLGSFGSSLNAGGRFVRPVGLWVDDAGIVYVLDGLGFRVEILTPDGKGRGVIGALGDGLGHFARPRGVAVDSQGHVYVSDAAFGNIQIFDSSGRLLLVYGGIGRAQGKFNLPAGLYIDGSDRIYVVDAYNHRMQLFQYLPE